jgi:hypothetical protein
MDYNPFKSGWATQETVQEKKMMCEKCGKMHENGDECEMNDDEKNEAMDPVNKKELKGKHADRKDKDLDNDGDADSSDKYLHKRRKAISKAMEDTKEGYYKDLEIKKQDKAMGAKPVPGKKKKEAKGGGKEGDVEMNPKMDSERKEQKESKIRTALKSVLESRDKHYEKAGPTETMKDMRKGKGAEDMMADADKEIAKGPDAHLNEPEIDKKNFQNMTKNVPSKKMRGNDNPKGDTKIVPGGTQFKDPAAMKPEESVTKGDDKQSGGFVKKESVSFAQSITNMGNAYASMYATEETELEEDLSHMKKHADSLADDHSAAAKVHDAVGNSDAARHHRKAAAALTAGDYKGAHNHGNKAVSAARTQKYDDGKRVRSSKQTAAMKKSNTVFSKHVDAHYKQGK